MLRLTTLLIMLLVKLVVEAVVREEFMFVILVVEHVLGLEIVGWETKRSPYKMRFSLVNLQNEEHFA